MIAKVSCLIALAVLLGSCKNLPDPHGDLAVRSVLHSQAAAWNAGDIDEFMSGYVDDGSLRFASGGTIERGFRPTLERYKARYPDRAAMGTLTFSDLEINVIDADDAMVFGRWNLERDEDTLGGLFTLHMVKRRTDWFIQSDHTSSAN